MVCNACTQGRHSDCEEPAAWTSCRCWWGRHGVDPTEWAATRKTGKPKVLTPPAEPEIEWMDF